MFNHLSTNCRQRQPDHESQLQPLMGLSLDDAKLAWERAVEIARGRKITAQLVKRAMRHLNLKKTTDPVPRPIRVNKAKQRELIDQSVGELLVLVSQKAAYDLITQKVEALHTHVHTLFAQMKPARA